MVHVPFAASRRLAEHGRRETQFVFFSPQARLNLEHFKAGRQSRLLSFDRRHAIVAAFPFATRVGAPNPFLSTRCRVLVMSPLFPHPHARITRRTLSPLNAAINRNPFSPRLEKNMALHRRRRRKMTPGGIGHADGATREKWGKAHQGVLGSRQQ